MRRLAPLALFAAFLTAGCIESDQQITVMPDGSGKIVWKIGVKMGDRAEMKPGDMKDNFKQMEDDTEGIVAWSVTEPKVEDGWMRLTMTAYFEDVSKVKMHQSSEAGQERKTILAFELAKGEQGTTLTVIDQLSRDMAKQPEKPEEATEEAKKMAEEMKKSMKEMFKGFKMVVAVEVPGTITKSTAWTETKGNRASLVFDDQMMFDSMDEKPEVMEKLKGLEGDRTVTWQKDETPADKVEAFKKELAEAKAAWAKAKEDAK